MERELLNRVDMYAPSAARYDPTNFTRMSVSDEELIKKYEDGSKAKEYYGDLQ
jgi:hypothetical protein